MGKALRSRTPQERQEEYPGRTWIVDAAVRPGNADQHEEQRALIS